MIIQQTSTCEGINSTDSYHIIVEPNVLLKTAKTNEQTIHQKSQVILKALGDKGKQLIENSNTITISAKDNTYEEIKTMIYALKTLKLDSIDEIKIIDANQISSKWNL